MLCRFYYCLLLTAFVLAGPLSVGVARAEVVVNGQHYATWQAYFYSDAFRDNAARCGTPDEVEPASPTAKAIDSDCGAANTNPSSAYAPARSLIRIPIVFHVITDTQGNGAIPPERIASQLAVVNEDFRAFADSPGANGADTNIEFFLATEDPDGQATTGIVSHVNDDWFNDASDYWTSTAWDPSRYTNVYTNVAGGQLGYVPFRPSKDDGVLVGTPQDRVVVLWSLIGRDAPAGPPYDQGRTLTHELGHYLGLIHPFASGCTPLAKPLCYSTGDLICDTPPVAAAQFGCPSGTSSCGNPDPTDNYMTYVDDVCMRGFTPEQARRMRCTLIQWRSALGERTEFEGVFEGEGEGEGEGPSEGEGEGDPLLCPDNPVGDPSFEIGIIGSPWTGSSNNFVSPLCTEESCGLNANLGSAQGEFWAWFGGIVNQVEEASLTQSINFGLADGLLLSLQLAMPQVGSTGYMQLEIDNVLLFKVTELDGPAYTTYAPVTLDITAYADGNPHVLRLSARTEAGAGPLNFFVDALCSETFSQPEGEGVPAQHSADQDGNSKFSLSELLRVIQFYNVGSLHCAGGTEDGYAPGVGDQDCSAHSSDYAPSDWVISLSELLRGIQFYDSLGFDLCPSGEDGFCPRS